MSRLFLILVFSSATFMFPPPAQAQDSPLHETRGVWLTTVWRLDWPPQGGADFQQQRLREIIARIKSLGMNTIMFQVVSHGEAMYPSERLPWAHWLTGTPGRDPGYDPLALAIEEAHRQGLEVHAWYNVFHIAAVTSNHSTEAEPLHVRYAHPGWVRRYEDPSGGADSFWLNPGIPGVRDWIVGNAIELVENYDLDGIHFDYMRYPSHGFDDDAAIRAEYPNAGASLDNWRRENINMLVRNLHAEVKTRNPAVKVGSSPVGAYRWFTGAPPGFWGWNDLYQDARAWLSEGVHDYVAPMMYFTIGNEPEPGRAHNSQDFEHWVKDWVANSHGRHVYAGLGTWREVADQVYPPGEIATQIAMTREEHAAGQVHFRYTHTVPAPFGGYYASPTLPPPMTWLENGAAPTAPAGTEIAWDPDDRRVTVSWLPSEESETDQLRRYAVFRREGAEPDVTSGNDLFAVLGSQSTTFEEVFETPPSTPIYYTVVAQSQLGFLSDAGATVNTHMTALTAGAEVPPATTRILDLYPQPSAGPVNVLIDVAVPSRLTMPVYDMLGRRVTVLQDGWVGKGPHRLELDAASLPAGVYVMVLETGDTRDTRRFVLID